MLGYEPKHDAGLSDQMMLPGFFFDDTAKLSSQHELIEQLPDKIIQHSGGISFNQLFLELTNESPASAEIMKEFLNDLAKDGVISIKDETGLTTRRGAIQADSDIIIPSRQSRFIFT